MVISLKLKTFIIIVLVVLTVLSAFVLFAPVIQAYDVNGSLVRGATHEGAQFQYEMDALGPICFSHKNPIIHGISNCEMTISYVNVTLGAGSATFSVSLYGQPNSSVALIKSFKFSASSSSQIYQSFFPPDLTGNGEFYHVFNAVAEDKETTTVYSTINVGTGSLYSFSQEVILLNVAGQPTGFWGQVSKEMDANIAYYVDTPSNAFLSDLCFSGNSTAISQLLGSSSVTNVTLFSLQLTKEDSALSSLNLQHYITQYLSIAIIIWVVGVMYIVSVYRGMKRKGRR